MAEQKTSQTEVSKEHGANKQSQKKLAEYDHYAKKSLVLGIIGFVLPCLFPLVLRIFRLILKNPTLTFGYIFLLVCITSITLFIFGVVFGKKGLKSNKASMSKAGLIVSIIGLSSPLLVIIYVLAGGEFM